MKNKKPVPCRNVLFKSDRKEALVLDLEGGTYRFLNEAGRTLWKEMDGKKSTEEITRRFAEKYGISRKRAARDVGRYLGELQKEKLIQFL